MTRIRRGYFAPRCRTKIRLYKTTSMKNNKPKSRSFEIKVCSEYPQCCQRRFTAGNLCQCGH